MHTVHIASERGQNANALAPKRWRPPARWYGKKGMNTRHWRTLPSAWQWHRSHLWQLQEPRGLVSSPLGRQIGLPSNPGSNQKRAFRMWCGPTGVRFWPTRHRGLMNLTPACLQWATYKLYVRSCKNRCSIPRC